MYKCPRTDCASDGSTFIQDADAVATVSLSADGRELCTEYERIPNGRRSHVRCECGARAEWIDARQVELFPIAPTLCA